MAPTRLTASSKCSIPAGQPADKAQATFRPLGTQIEQQRSLKDKAKDFKESRLGRWVNRRLVSHCHTAPDVVAPCHDGIATPKASHRGISHGYQGPKFSSMRRWIACSLSEQGMPGAL